MWKEKSLLRVRPSAQTVELFLVPFSCQQGWKVASPFLRECKLLMPRDLLQSQPAFSSSLPKRLKVLDLWTSLPGNERESK